MLGLFTEHVILYSQAPLYIPAIGKLGSVENLTSSPIWPRRLAFLLKCFLSVLGLLDCVATNTPGPTLVPLSSFGSATSEKAAAWCLCIFCVTQKTGAEFNSRGDGDFSWKTLWMLSVADTKQIRIILSDYLESASLGHIEIYCTCLFPTLPFQRVYLEPWMYCRSSEKPKAASVKVVFSVWNMELASEMPEKRIYFFLDYNVG